MHQQNISSVEELGEVAKSLNALLADEYQLYVITRRAQREIKETNINGMDKFFENQFEVLEKIIQSTDERVRTFGRFSPNSLNDFLKVGRLNGSNQRAYDQINMINKLLEYHKLLVNLLRSDITTILEVHNDSDTASFLSELLEQHEKIIWMLESHLT
jgi:starvation-inducible DNA-binding protein